MLFDKQFTMRFGCHILRPSFRALLSEWPSSCYLCTYKNEIVPLISYHTSFESFNLKRITFQTDDFGVFSTSLTKELEIASDTFNLSSDDLIKLSRIAIDSSFASDDEKQIIRHRIDSFAKSLLTQ